MKETPSAALRRVGKTTLERLAWVVDFAQRALSEDISDAELELNCFVFGEHLFPDTEGQISALIRGGSKLLAYSGQEVTHLQQRFLEVLSAAAGRGTEKLPLKYVIAHFTRADGLEYVPNILGGRADGSITKEQQTESKLSLAVFKLLRLLDQTVRAKSGGRFIPLRMYVSICPEEHDGCGKLFAKSRIYQEHCSRTCTVRHQVRQCRKRAEQKKKMTARKSRKTAPEM